jgi:hypothetical protein
LSNIYLHEVLDKWFEQQVKQRLEARAELIRFADDYVILLANERDARRVQTVLPKRFGKYDLALHETKTRLVDFNRPKPSCGKSETFVFLGFTHCWGRSRKGKRVVQRKTASKKLKESLQRVYRWCKAHRHDPITDQHRALCRKMSGH